MNKYPGVVFLIEPHVKVDFHGWFSSIYYLGSFLCVRTISIRKINLCDDLIIHGQQAATFPSLVRMCNIIVSEVLASSIWGEQPAGSSNEWELEIGHLRVKDCTSRLDLSLYHLFVCDNVSPTTTLLLLALLPSANCIYIYMYVPILYMLISY
jgi:hypothetical protein